MRDIIKHILSFFSKQHSQLQSVKSSESDIVRAKIDDLHMDRFDCWYKQCTKAYDEAGYEVVSQQIDVKCNRVNGWVEFKKKSLVHQ